MLLPMSRRCLLSTGKPPPLLPPTSGRTLIPNSLYYRIHSPWLRVVLRSYIGKKGFGGHGCLIYLPDGLHCSKRRHECGLGVMESISFQSLRCRRGIEITLQGY